MMLKILKVNVGGFDDAFSKYMIKKIHEAKQTKYN
jgi:hypothetical protein